MNRDQVNEFLIKYQCYRVSRDKAFKACQQALLITKNLKSIKSSHSFWILKHHKAIYTEYVCGGVDIYFLTSILFRILTSIYYFCNSCLKFLFTGMRSHKMALCTSVHHPPPVEKKHLNVNKRAHSVISIYRV